MSDLVGPHNLVFLMHRVIFLCNDNHHSVFGPRLIKGVWLIECQAKEISTRFRVVDKQKRMCMTGKIKV